MTTQFKNKTVIITGASMGVGAETARTFAELGANLVLVARGRKALDDMAAELREKTRVETVAMDVADADACVNLLKKAAFEFDNIHILVNNAGYHERGPVESNEAEHLGRMVDVNLKAPIILTRLVLPYLRDAGPGSAIIQVASLAGRTTVPGAATYSATKFGLRAFTFSLAEELAGSGIKVACVSPGPIDTGFIMADIDRVTDITFSQPMSTAKQVADTIVELVINEKLDQPMPPISGVLTTLTYLFPWLGRALRPALERRGRRAKDHYKRRAAAVK